MRENNNPEDGKFTAGKNISLWLNPEISFDTYPFLNENMQTDIVIVGGGLAGLSVAYCLSQAGRKVVIVEDGLVGSGETGRTTAHLVTALDDRYYNFEKVFGKENTKLIAESHKAAIDFVERTIKNENIDCGFERVDGYLFLHPSDEKDSLEKELQAAQRAGIDVVELPKVPGLISDEGKCLRFPSQAQFHPMKYLAGLCKAIIDKGGKIFTGTHAKEINHEGITSDKGFIIKANHVVVATNAAVNDMWAIMLKQYAYRTYVIGALIKKDIMPKALWWDTGDYEANSGLPPYHYVRVHTYNEHYDLILSGGEDHITAHKDTNAIPEETRYKLLEDWTRKHFAIGDIVYHWSGEVLEPMDGVAFIGRNPYDKENVYLVTGDSGNGMTHCTIAGILISDLILGNQNKWETIYKPSRFTWKSSGPFFRMLKDDLINVLKKWFYSDITELSSIQKGEAKIVKLEGQKCGAYRDEKGRLHIVSTECTHLKCMLKWNNDEKSWDCPCHGSRFTYTGKVINGPANFDLEAYSEPIVKGKEISG